MDRCSFQCRCVDRPFFEPPVEHKDVVEMYGKVRIQRPRNFRNRATPFVAPRYSVARNDQIPRNSVQSVLLAFPPIETPPSRNRHISSRSQRQCRFETNRIARPEAGIPSTSEAARGFDHAPPGANVACAEAAELVHALEVVSPQSISPEPGS